MAIILTSQKMTASDFAAMLYDDRLVVRIRENIGLAPICVAGPSG